MGWTQNRQHHYCVQEWQFTVNWEAEWVERWDSGAWRIGTHGDEDSQGHGPPRDSNKLFEKKREEASDHLGADEYLVSSDATQMQEMADTDLHYWHSACVSPTWALPFFVEVRWEIDLDGYY